MAQYFGDGEIKVNKISAIGGITDTIDLNGIVVIDSDGYIRGYIDGSNYTDLKPVFTFGAEKGWQASQIRLTGGRFDFDQLDGKAELRMHGNPTINFYDTDFGRIAFQVANDRQVTIYNKLHMSSSVITDVANPVDAQDAATKNYVDNAVSVKPDDSSVVHLTGDESISDTKTFTDLNGIVMRLQDSTPGIPITSATGPISIKGGDGSTHLALFVDTDGDGDYDADIWAKDNLYIASENAIHFRPKISIVPGGNPDVGRMIYDATSNGNYFEVGVNYSGTIGADLIFAPYGNTTQNWLKFDYSNLGYALLGGADTDNPAARLHAKDSSPTVGFLESTNSTCRITFRASGSTSNTGVGVGAIGDNLVLRAGSTNVAQFTSTTLDMQSHKVVNVTDPTSIQDAATKGYVDTATTGNKVMNQATAPTAASNQAIMWTASGSGTKDGTAYEQGDVLVTSNVGGTSKTKLLMDWSTS